MKYKCFYSFKSCIWLSHFCIASRQKRCVLLLWRHTENGLLLTFHTNSTFHTNTIDFYTLIINLLFQKDDDIQDGSIVINKLLYFENVPNQRQKMNKYYRWANIYEIHVSNVFIIIIPFWWLIVLFPVSTKCWNVVYRSWNIVYRSCVISSRSFIFIIRIFFIWFRFFMWFHFR